MLTSERIHLLARQCGFELAGVADARPHADFSRFQVWRDSGYAGEMGYLTDHRGAVRSDPRHLLPSAQSIICVGKLYNSEPDKSETSNIDPGNPVSSNGSPLGSVARYAAGTGDYHDVLRGGLRRLEALLRSEAQEEFECRICVDTAPLLERSYARQAGLGWIGRNTCLINQEQGSWFFLGFLLISLPLSPGLPPPDRCGSCRRCIDGCPTAALVPSDDGGWTLNSRRCISYLTIEARGSLHPDQEALTGTHLFGCDICQEVCPWNRRASFSDEPAFQPVHSTLPLREVADLDPSEFRLRFHATPIWRTRYQGMIRNVAVALGNSGDPNMVGPLETLAAHSDPIVSSAAGRSIVRLREHLNSSCTGSDC